MVTFDYCEGCGGRGEHLPGCPSFTLHVPNHPPACPSCADLRARLERAEKMLLDYGTHKPTCPAYADGASNCVCGWQVIHGDARVALEKKHG